jgi:hypothetical protein
MPTEPFDARGFISTLQLRGWSWCPNHAGRLVHPDDHDLYLRYSDRTDRLTASPKLEEYLDRVIPTPPGRRKTPR